MWPSKSVRRLCKSYFKSHHNQIQNTIRLISLKCIHSIWHATGHPLKLLLQKLTIYKYPRKPSTLITRFPPRPSVPVIYSVQKITPVYTSITQLNRVIYTKRKNVAKQHNGSQVWYSMGRYETSTSTLHPSPGSWWDPPYTQLTVGSLAISPPPGCQWWRTELWSGPAGWVSSSVLPLALWWYKRCQYIHDCRSTWQHLCRYHMRNVHFHHIDVFQLQDILTDNRTPTGWWWCTGSARIPRRG